MKRINDQQLRIKEKISFCEEELRKNPLLNKNQLRLKIIDKYNESIDYDILKNTYRMFFACNPQLIKPKEIELPSIEKSKETVHNKRVYIKQLLLEYPNITFTQVLKELRDKFGSGIKFEDYKKIKDIALNPENINTSYYILENNEMKAFDNKETLEKYILKQLENGKTLNEIIVLEKINPTFTLVF